MSVDKIDAVTGCLLGCAAGDSVGLPYEGLPTKRAMKFLRFPLEHRFFFGRGMVSDDTDHTVFVLQSVIVSQGDPDEFRKALGWRLRLWLLCLPAGIGMATLRSIIRLWFGFRVSGVYSAGNGPAMRSAVIGAALCDDSAKRSRYVEASTLLTHTDPKALAGAMAVAEIAARLASGEWKTRPAIAELIEMLGNISDNKDWIDSILLVGECLRSAVPVQTAYEKFGSRHGISGYTLHTVPFAIVVWYHNFGDFRGVVEAVCRAGGDVDTVAAIAGGLAGTTSGPSGIPKSWIEGISDWPHSHRYMGRLARKYFEPDINVPVSFSPWLFFRGIVFTVIVLAHGFRRLLPPY